MARKALLTASWKHLSLVSPPASDPDANRTPMEVRASGDGLSRILISDEMPALLLADAPAHFQALAQTPAHIMFSVADRKERDEMFLIWQSERREENRWY